MMTQWMEMFSAAVHDMQRAENADARIEAFREATSLKSVIDNEWRRLKGVYDEAAVELLQQVGDVQVGELRYYAGTVTDVKPRKKPGETLGHLLDWMGGDLDRIGDCLSSSAWKQGAVRSHVAECLGEQDADDLWGQIFERREVVEVKTGKPKRQAKAVPA